jgi:hypothetical protein
MTVRQAGLTLCVDRTNRAVAAASTKFLPDNQLQPRPHFGNRADLHVDETKRQSHLTNRVFGDVGRHFGALFGPRRPYNSVGSKHLPQIIEAFDSAVLRSTNTCITSVNCDGVVSKLTPRGSGSSSRMYSSGVRLTSALSCAGLSTKLTSVSSGPQPLHRIRNVVNCR